jgi:hypothetical protein
MAKRLDCHASIAMTSGLGRVGRSMEPFLLRPRGNALPACHLERMREISAFILEMKHPARGDKGDFSRWSK